MKILSFLANGGTLAQIETQETIVYRFPSFGVQSFVIRSLDPNPKLSIKAVIVPTSYLLRSSKTYKCRKSTRIQKAPGACEP